MRRASLGKRSVASSPRASSVPQQRPCSPPASLPRTGSCQSGCHYRTSSAAAPGSSTPWGGATPTTSPDIPRRSPRPPHAFHDVSGAATDFAATGHESSLGHSKSPQPLSLLPQRQEAASSLPNGPRKNARKLRQSSEPSKDVYEHELVLANGGDGSFSKPPSFSSFDWPEPPDTPTSEPGVPRAALRSASRMIATQLVANAAAQAASDAAGGGKASDAAAGMAPAAASLSSSTPLPILLLLALRRRCCAGPLLLRHALQMAALCAVIGMALLYMRMPVGAERLADSSLSYVHAPGVAPGTVAEPTSEP